METENHIGNLRKVMETAEGRLFLLEHLTALKAFGDIVSPDDVITHNVAEALLDHMAQANPKACLAIIAQGRGINLL